MTIITRARYLRYHELLAAGPTITDADRQRLRTFVPRLTPIARAVRAAFFTSTAR